MNKIEILEKLFSTGILLIVFSCFLMLTLNKESLPQWLIYIIEYSCVIGFIICLLTSIIKIWVK